MQGNRGTENNPSLLYRGDVMPKSGPIKAYVKAACKERRVVLRSDACQGEQFVVRKVANQQRQQTGVLNSFNNNAGSRSNAVQIRYGLFLAYKP